ncbi:helix-turn-helix domain-containing protein [Pandoraea pnomenusa]|uniref:helix-turn-helix transcriptional regulator n=1 Tax=Pandoraea pnomenusa TaxID=93220 RepID=UPI003341B299
MSAHTSPKLYRVKAAMQQLGVSKATIYRLVADGRLTLVKIGKHASGITAESIEQLVRQSRPTG